MRIRVQTYASRDGHRCRVFVEPTDFDPAQNVDVQTIEVGPFPSADEARVAAQAVISFLRERGAEVDEDPSYTFRPR